MAMFKIEQLQVDAHNLSNQYLFYTFPPCSSALRSVLSIVKSDPRSEPDYGGVSVSTGEPGLERRRAGVFCSESVPINVSQLLFPIMSQLMLVVVCPNSVPIDVRRFLSQFCPS